MFARTGSRDLGGVVGTVADLLEVPNGLEAAVEAVLGDRLQWVVVERFEHARAALGYLEREGAGAATLLPLETLPARGPARGLRRGELGRAARGWPAAGPAPPPRPGGASSRIWIKPRRCGAGTASSPPT
jgi:hypothetical protein